MARSISGRRSAEPEEESRSVRRRKATRDSGESRSTRRSTPKRGSAQKSGRGWAAASQARKARAGFADSFKVEKEKIIIKFLENGPYDTYYEHWLKELPQGVKKSWTCIAEDDDGTGCPLCETLDDIPAFRAAFNIVDMTGGREPRIQQWVVTPDPWDRIEEAHDDYGDISVPDMYFAVSKVKNKNNRFTYKLERVKERDLEEDGWDVEPLDEDELEGFLPKLYTEKDTRYPSEEDLNDIVSQLGD